MKKTQITVSTLRTGQKVDFGEGKAKGKVKSLKVRVEMEDGMVVMVDNWTGVYVITEDEDLCPNGQDRSECREIDPCEMCMQDQDAEGDMIEISMGLKNRIEVPVADEDEDEDGRYSCKGCSGTCCTGVPNQECTC